MIRLALALLAFSLALPFARPAAAAEEYTLDNPHTQILFSVNHLGFSHSYGKFTDYDGAIVFDREHPEKSTANVTIKTASLDLNHDKWNEHLRGPDYFNVEKFPDMTFKSTGITVTGEKTGDLTGDLTLLGVTKPVTLRVTFSNEGAHPFSGKHVAGFSASGTLKRSDFGMISGLPMVGDDVNLIIEVEAIRADQQEQPQQ